MSCDHLVVRADEAGQYVCAECGEIVERLWPDDPATCAHDAGEIVLEGWWVCVECGEEVRPVPDERSP